MSSYDEVTILLVEDSLEDAELTILSLRKGNLADRLHHVQDGVAALDFLFARGPYEDRTTVAPLKVVLLDLKLPKISGLDVLRTLRQNPRTGSLPVVVMTSSNQERDLETAYRLGANSYVVKPVDSAAFAAAVGNLGTYWVMLNEVPKLTVDARDS